nr:hypothetical protein [Tanacetum cinerariifolium]
MCDSILAENTNADVIPCMVSHVDDSITKGAPIVDDNLSSKVLPNDVIVKSVGIHEKASSYVGAAEGSKSKPSKSKTNFRLLFLENLCEGVNISIPRNVVETAFSEYGLSIIASNICKPIMLDSYTSSMCIESWGRSSFSRCLIEINAKDVLPESLTIGVPLIENTGFNIEYEWKPPYCDLC